MKTILTIDDEKEFGEMIKNYFEPRGFRVLIAYNGVEGLELAKSQKPDVALIDLKMPGLHGDQVLGSLRAACPETKSIMITASDDMDRDTGKLMRLGAFDCFDKPITSLKALEEKIKEAMGTA